MDITTLNAMVSIYGCQQMVKKVNEILDFMKESEFTPSLTTYNSLMYMYSRSGSFLRAAEVLKEIAGYGLQHEEKEEVDRFNASISRLISTRNSGNNLFAYFLCIMYGNQSLIRAKETRMAVKSWEL
ncbi:hypothetical protein SOVF_208690 [Spinacia oleracea]|nr:hypothetical protein SOVF_208690 [Spinacia oleracea]